jgi:hypothetical protein
MRAGTARRSRMDELWLHLAPALLGAGVRLFERIGPEHGTLEPRHVVESPRVTHLAYRILK